MDSFVCLTSLLFTCMWKTHVILRDSPLFVKVEIEECPSLQGYPGGGHQPPGAPYGGNNPYGHHPSAPYAGQPSAGPYTAPGQGGPYAPPGGPYGSYGGQPQGGYYGHHVPAGKYEL